MMLAASDMEQAEHGLLGMCDDLSSFMCLPSDTLLYSDSDVFSSLLDDRSAVCNSVSSSSCSSVTSEISDYDIGISDTLDAFLFDRSVKLTPSPPRPTLHSSCRKDNDCKRKNHSSSSKSATTIQKWTSLNSSQQTSLLEQLMETVSEKLGLREQLDIINIINPKAQLSPTDTEFFIDFDLMDDRKYELVKLYVEKELRRQRKLNDADKNNGKTIGQSEQVSKRSTQQKLSRPDRLKQKQEKLSKMCKQLRKERRSGLFSREQVIAVGSLSPSEPTEQSEEEVDILT